MLFPYYHHNNHLLSTKMYLGPTQNHWLKTSSSELTQIRLLIDICKTEEEEGKIWDCNWRWNVKKKGCHTRVQVDVSSNNPVTANIIREGAKFTGPQHWKLEIFCPEKSLGPLIFFSQKRGSPHIFLSWKSLCPVIFFLGKSLSPPFHIAAKKQYWGIFYIDFFKNYAYFSQKKS